MNTNFRPELLLRPLERLRSIVMTTSVCVCVCPFFCLSAGEDLQNHTRDLYQFCACCHMAVAWSVSGVVAMRYVLSVLWITSYFLQWAV